MTDQHPITLPPELVEQWRTAPEYASDTEKLTMVSMTTRRLQEIADQAARWGADQELEACCEYIAGPGKWFAAPQFRLAELRATRRPKPPSLKEQALAALDSFEGFTGSLEEVDTIRRALEQLDD